MFIDCRSTDDNKSNAAELKQREKDRSITNLRNKDRPSIQIYQPGKRRANSLTTSEDNPTTPENENIQHGTNSEKPSKSNRNRKHSDAKESSKNANDDGKKSSNEKKISRYSEKRNKAKEKRDLNDNQPSDSIPSTNNDEKNNDLF